MERVGKARRKVGKDLLLKLVSNMDDLKKTASIVEAAAEEDKLEVENAFSAYESAVQSYESQLKDLQEKLANRNLEEAKAMKDEQLKESLTKIEQLERVITT